MSFIDTKGRFHCALNGVGLLLQGAPNQLGYQQSQVVVYGQRFASGERSYNDLLQWWYFVQTDWSGGAKDSVSWQDDAMYYYSTNIDAWSQPGSIKLTRKQSPAGATGDNNFTYPIYCGFEGEVASTSYKFIGTGDNADARPHIWQSPLGEAQTWTDISTTTIGTNQNAIAQLSARLGILWASTVGLGSTWVVATWNGTTWTDQSAIIYNAGTTISFQPASSRCHTSYVNTKYVFVDNTFNNKYALVKTTVANPTVAGDWSKVFEISNSAGIPIACVGYNGSIYYLTNHSTYVELWQYDITAATNILIRTFNNVSINNIGVAEKLLVDFGGDLIITIPHYEIWKLSGLKFTRIYIKDEFKRGGDTLAEIDAYLDYGCVVQDNKCWWGNLSYDGEHFYNTWKNDADSNSNNAYPVFADSSLRIWETHIGNTSVIWSVTTNGISYKGTADKNFIVFSNFDTVSGIDKLAYTATIVFKPLLTGQSIVVEYLSGEFSTSSTWTALGTASYAIDGGVVGDKQFLFPVATTFKKLWIRIKLNSGGSDTPTLNDFVMEYLPAPTDRKLWSINVNASNSIKRLDGALAETTGRELRSMLERSWWTKSTLDFQDFDYATTTISDNPLSASATTINVASTIDFPEQGRLHCDNEEILYTGKNNTSFTGCTRGARGSRAVSHTQNTVINNAYKVTIKQLQSSVPIALMDKDLEYTVHLTLHEV